MNVSIFKNITSKQPLPGFLEGVANLIRSDEKLKVFTKSYRQTGSKTFKSECPLFAVACHFNGGKGKEHITGLTGLSLVDFDHISQSKTTHSPLQLPQGGETQSTPVANPPLTSSPLGGTEGGSSASISALKAKIIADPHTLMCYTTVSGEGLRIIFKYELPPTDVFKLHTDEKFKSHTDCLSLRPAIFNSTDHTDVDSYICENITSDKADEKSVSSVRSVCQKDLDAVSSYYQQAFYAGNAYYENLLGVKADMQCKNLTRLSGLAHDPEVFLRPESEAVPFTAEEISTAAAAYAKQSKEDKQMQRIQTYFDTLIAPQLAKANIVFQSGSHNEYVMRVGYRLAERRFSKKVAIRWAVGQFGADYPDTEQVINSCFDNASPHGKGGGGGGSRGDNKTASVEEIKSFLDGHVSLRFNEITNRVETHPMPSRREGDEDTKYFVQGSAASHSLPSGGPGWVPLTDRIVNSLWSQMSAVTRVNIQDMYRVIESDYVPSYHPFKDYLNSLPNWHDGDHDFIADLASTVTVKGSSHSSLGETDGATDLWSRYLKKWLVAMVASWINNDVVNNVILVLIGEQGAYKTTWFNYLLPPELKQYFYTKTNANRMSKDDLLTLAQYGLVCCEELDTMRPSELNQLKAVVTMPSIDERAAYAHYHEHREHIASFCGTGNNAQFLSDPTGNRRWLPFEVESIRSPREFPFNYTGIYSQALALYKSGFLYWFTSDEIKVQNRHNKQFETPRLEHELVALYFRKPTPNEVGTFISSARAIQIIGTGISQKLNPTKIGMAFHDLGFERVRYHSIRGYLVIIRSADEMQAYQRGIGPNNNSDDDFEEMPF